MNSPAAEFWMTSGTHIRNALWNLIDSLSDGTELNRKVNKSFHFAEIYTQHIIQIHQEYWKFVSELIKFIQTKTLFVRLFSLSCGSNLLFFSKKLFFDWCWMLLLIHPLQMLCYFAPTYIFPMEKMEKITKTRIILFCILFHFRVRINVKSLPMGEESTHSTQNSIRSPLS